MTSRHASNPGPTHSRHGHPKHTSAPHVPGAIVGAVGGVSDKDFADYGRIGVRTFGWTFVNRGLATPGPAPHVRLAAPGGDIWEIITPPSS